MMEIEAVDERARLPAHEGCLLSPFVGRLRRNCSGTKTHPRPATPGTALLTTGHGLNKIRQGSARTSRIL